MRFVSSKHIQVTRQVQGLQPRTRFIPFIVQSHVHPLFIIRPVELYFHRMQPRSQGPRPPLSDEEHNDILMDSVNDVDVFGHIERILGGGRQNVSASTRHVRPPFVVRSCLRRRLCPDTGTGLLPFLLGPCGSRQLAMVPGNRFGNQW